MADIKGKMKYHADDLDPKEEEKEQISHSDDDYETEGCEDEVYDNDEDMKDYKEEEYKDMKGSLINDIENCPGNKKKK
jgi:hypothetical protein